MRKKKILECLKDIKNSCLNINKDLFKDEDSYKRFQDLFCYSWIFCPLEEIKKELER
jgi:hypothetical protein